MVKYLVLVLLVAALIWWARASRRPRGGAGQSSTDGAKADARAQSPVMVECAHCGLHLPRTEALAGPGGTFCSEAHRAAGAKATPGGSDH